MGIRIGASALLRKKAKRGFRGYPVATVCFYGPTDQFASKIAVGIIRNEGEHLALLERWFSNDSDIRLDPAVGADVARFILANGARSVVMSDGIIGCPHETGIDYPEGTSCPKCPYWAGRDRFTKDRIH